jgi:SAM-dependent methyltransferase
MALQGIKVLAFDLSAEAIAIAQRRGSECAQGREVIFAQHDLASGIQARSGEFDLVSDIFVYKHQMSPDVRRTYRSEVKRVLSSAGRFLVSLAERDDGYYSGCPDVMPSAEPVGRPIMDPVAGVGSVLFDLPELVEEMSDCFRLEMSWHKMKAGMMHGKIYVRRTLATIWAIAETENVA